MAESQFAIVFQGQVVDGADPQQVRANLGKLFKAPPEQIEKMFSGQKVVLKKGLDSVAAGKYKVALGKAGALVDAVAMKAAAASKPAASAPEPAKKRVIPPSAAPQTTPKAFADSENPPAALDTSLADAGEVLVEYQQTEAPDITTDHLSVAEVGETLVEAQPVPEPEYDLSAMSLDPAGTTLTEPAPVAAPEYSFEGLSMAENPDSV